jgi:hypothetical protein
MTLLRGRNETYVLDALGKAIVADHAFPLFVLCVVEPFDAFVDEPTEDLQTDEIGDGCAADGRVVAEETAEKVECGKRWG